jgi:hypothetical protein
MNSTTRIMMLCPTTRKSFDTGIRTSGRDVLGSDLYDDAQFACPYCGQLHEAKGNAYPAIEFNEGAGALWRPNA